MKIIYGITKSNFGGAQRYVFDLATEAKKLGHDVSVLCGGNGPLVKKLEEDNIRVITLPYMQRDISLVDELRSLHFIFRTLVEERPDIFHTNSSKMGGLGNFVARLAGVKKIIFTSHGWEFTGPRPVWQKPIIKFFSWLTVLFSHTTICVSQRTREDILSWPFVKNKLHVVLNGIESFDLLPRGEARKSLGLGEALTVGTLTELRAIKGNDVLLLAWNKFSKKYPEAKLVILGDGDDRKILESFSEALGISNSVIFMGYINNARQYLNAFDIFCLASRRENLPYAVLEAGFAGLPVVATAVGGIPEIIENGMTGALVPPEDSETLFSTLVLLAQDEALRRRLGTALHQNVSEKFLLRKMVSETLALYK